MSTNTVTCWHSYTRLLSFFLLCTALLYAPTGAQSQATTGVIRGFVWDQFNNPIGNATIVLKETGTNYQRILTSSDLGLFTATLLPLGFYDVTVQAEGQAEVRQTGVQVRVGETVELVVKMILQMDEMVIVATRPTVDVTRTETATRLPEEAVQGLAQQRAQFLNLTLLTPGVSIVQGPDGDELTIAGQRGIHNNISVDGADFNNPFFGEQRGGQRPAFTFNLDAVAEIVVVPQGANAEFGRSSGGFVNVITKSGTNKLHGSVHFFGKHNALSGIARHKGTERTPRFKQGQFGFTLGGPLVVDRAFFFAAYDQQVFRDTRQNDIKRVDARLRHFMDTAFDGALSGDYGAIDRTNDARAFWPKSITTCRMITPPPSNTITHGRNRKTALLMWTRGHAVPVQSKKTWSHAFNGSFISLLSASTINEFRFQIAREDRPRPYGGPVNPNTGRPFPDTGMDFMHGYRFGMPFFIRWITMTPASSCSTISLWPGAII